MITLNRPTQLAIRLVGLLVSGLAALTCLLLLGLNELGVQLLLPVVGRLPWLQTGLLLGASFGLALLTVKQWPSRLTYRQLGGHCSIIEIVVIGGGLVISSLGIYLIIYGRLFANNLPARLLAAGVSFVLIQVCANALIATIVKIISASRHHPDLA